MKKTKKLHKLKPKVPKSLKRPLTRSKDTEVRVTEALQDVPRITNETVAEHREEVLGSARKYIYPLQHSKHHIVRISLLILIGVLLSFFVYCGIALYRFQSTSGFMYGVTRVVPFPVAKVGKDWVSYESYLFELRRNMHYYQTQQSVDFSSKDGKAQLKNLKKQAMDQVIKDAYVKQLARKYDVSVSNKAVDAQIALVRAQNRLGSSQRVFKEVLNEFWGWDEGDFKRELKQQLLQQAVVAKLDTATTARANAALKQLQAGADFSKLAAQVSDDASTKANGGQYPIPITPDNADLAPGVTAALFKLQPGQISGIVNPGYTLEILKAISNNKTSVTAAHIQFNLADISVYTKPLQKANPPHIWIGVNGY